MTNVDIIKAHTAKLIADGAIKEEEAIHTYQGWKALGMQVKKGEHAITKLQIWKKSKGKNVKAKVIGADGTETGEEKTTVTAGHFFLTTAAFFSSAQVEAISA